MKVNKNRQLIFFFCVGLLTNVYTNKKNRGEKQQQQEMIHFKMVFQFSFDSEIVVIAIIFIIISLKVLDFY